MIIELPFDIGDFVYLSEIDFNKSPASWWVRGPFKINTFEIDNGEGIRTWARLDKLMYRKRTDLLFHTKEAALSFCEIKNMEKHNYV